MMECPDEITLYAEEFCYGWICIDMDRFECISYGATKEEAYDNWDRIYSKAEVGRII